MNVNRFYKELFEETLGLDVLGLESTFTGLVKMIESKTLLTFSNNIPVSYRIYLDLDDHKKLIQKDHYTLGSEYYLSDPILDKFHLPILSIEDINYNNPSTFNPYDPQSSTYYNQILTSRNNLSIDDILMGAEYTYNRTMTNFALPYNMYYELRGDHVLYLRNYNYMGPVEIIVRTRYPNLVSIPEEYREIFMKLAKFDVKIKLWNELKYMNDIVTPAGNLNLRIDEWESADRDREDYLRDLAVKTLPDRVGNSFFTVV